VQRLAMLLNFILMLAVLPVAIKLIDNKDIFEKSNPMWLWMIPVMLLLLFIMSKWAYHWYQHNANAAEQLIRELDN
jgi:EamA domain-containing membrane protein RarD